jgi:pyruvate,water dikinase
MYYSILRCITYYGIYKKFSELSALDSNIAGGKGASLAREIKKPYIVGTKIATKVLKDGDIVEVDANSGTVTILT